VNLNSALQYAIANKNPNLKIIDSIGKLAKGFDETPDIMNIALTTIYNRETIRVEVLKKLLPLLFKPNKINHYSVNDIFPYAMVYIQFTSNCLKDCSIVSTYLLEVSTYLEPTNSECEILQLLMAMRKCFCYMYPHYFLMFCMHSSVNINDIKNLRLYENIRENSNLFLCLMSRCGDSVEQLLFSQKIAVKMFNLKLFDILPNAKTIENFIECFSRLFHFWVQTYRKPRNRNYKLLELFWNFGLNFDLMLALTKNPHFDPRSKNKFDTLQSFVSDMLLSFKVGYLFSPISKHNIIYRVHKRFRLRYGLMPVSIRNGVILYAPYKEPSSLKEICRHTILAKALANSNPLHRQTMAHYFYEVSLLDIPMDMKEFLKYR
jgi:hypothetical protein